MNLRFSEHSERNCCKTTGTAITKVLPPLSRIAANGGHGERKQRVLAKLGEFFERFFGLGSDGGQTVED